jgi:hypothetical protein
MVGMGAPYLKKPFMLSYIVSIFSIFGMAIFFYQTEYYFFRNIGFISMALAFVSFILDIRILYTSEKIERSPEFNLARISG